MTQLSSIVDTYTFDLSLYQAVKLRKQHKISAKDEINVFRRHSENERDIKVSLLDEFSKGIGGLLKAISTSYFHNDFPKKDCMDSTLSNSILYTGNKVLTPRVAENTNGTYFL